ncbi:hypothetical protein Halha_0815 [Halobacteroides halobius DSM 5150]|uniref:Uncharacterized protein n=1 Tax=Halobacteroides halobius (strain ATCC 35273 / DSM 5150 / MD-1) TaxID=748449 RepID=L0K717_HALHC|nr:hypothetical protein [Halobacteroides halobius]AGB40786.1 hypothetical protein Halha_0815 [Halobacteroides halobius DSM 5150]
MKQIKDEDKSVFNYVFSWQVEFALVLIIISAVLYFIHFQIFEDLHHILIFLVEDIAFIPIEVLLVTLIIHRLLDEREKEVKMKKLNMIIGTFYSEVGNQLISHFLLFDSNFKAKQSILQVDDEWTKEKFLKATNKLVDKKFILETNVTDCHDLVNLKKFLSEEKTFLLHLLDNPNLIEHDTFTDLLWAVFHLTEELMYRSDLQNLSDEDKDHILKDIERAYIELVKQWLLYMRHLQEDYPYLFSLAVRTNPFNPEATVEFE